MAEVTLSPGWATYLRVSDEDKQMPERSFAMQRKSIQEQLLAPSDIKFKHEYCDLLTGTDPSRADYQRMLADAKAGRFSHLGLYRADRFGRDSSEGQQTAKKLMAFGVKLRVATMPSLTPETPDGYFIFNLLMGVAQLEVDVLRQRTSGGMEANPVRPTAMGVDRSEDRATAKYGKSAPRDLLGDSFADYRKTCYSRHRWRDC